MPAHAAYERYVFGPLAGLKAYKGRVVVPRVGLLAIDVDDAHLRRRGNTSRSRARSRPCDATSLRPPRSARPAGLASAMSDARRAQHPLASDDALRPRLRRLGRERSGRTCRSSRPGSGSQHEGAVRFPDFRHFIIEAGAGCIRRPGFVILQGCRNPHGSVELKRIVLQPKGQGYGRVCVRPARADGVPRPRRAPLLARRQERERCARSTLYRSEGFVEEGAPARKRSQRRRRLRLADRDVAARAEYRRARRSARSAHADAARTARRPAMQSTMMDVPLSLEPPARSRRHAVSRTNRSSRACPTRSLRSAQLRRVPPAHAPPSPPLPRRSACRRATASRRCAWNHHAHLECLLRHSGRRRRHAHAEPAPGARTRSAGSPPTPRTASSIVDDMPAAAATASSPTSTRSRGDRVPALGRAGRRERRPSSTTRRFSPAPTATASSTPSTTRTIRSPCATPSGTTGRPKGRRLLASLDGAAHAGRLPRPTTGACGHPTCLLPVTPMFHANCWGLPYARGDDRHQAWSSRARTCIRTTCST